MSTQLFKRASLLTIIFGATMFATTSTYADGAEIFTAKGCTACHGESGSAPIMGAYPKLSGQNKEYIIQQLKDIKSGARNNGQTAAMKGIMAAVSEDEITALADYLSSVK